MKFSKFSIVAMQRLISRYVTSAFTECKICALSKKFLSEASLIYFQEWLNKSVYPVVILDVCRTLHSLDCCHWKKIFSFHG